MKTNIETYATELETAAKDLSSTVATQTETFEFNQEIKVDFGAYYEKHATQANASVSFSGMIPPAATANLDVLAAWITDDLKDAAVNYASRYFTEALEKTSLLSTLKEMAEKVGMLPQDLIETHLDKLVKFCHPFWKYEENRGLSAEDGVSILGVEDENSPLIPPRYRTDKMYQIKTTGFLDRIDLLRTAHGMPAFLLKGMKDYKVDYEKLRKGRDPLHILKDMEFAPDVFPKVEDQKSNELWAVGLALGYIVQIGYYYYFDLDRGYTSPEKIKPENQYKIGQGRIICAEAFRTKTEWQAELDEAVNKLFSEMGVTAAKAALDKAIKDLKLKIANTPPGDESLRKQYQKEVESLKNLKSKLG
jgi:hypothetical protein